MLIETILVACGSLMGGALALLIRRRNCLKKRQLADVNLLLNYQRDLLSAWSENKNPDPDHESIARIVSLLGEYEEQYQADLTRAAASQGKPAAIRFLELSHMLFRHEARARFSEPVIEEMREDYLLLTARSASDFEMVWLKFCFWVRAIGAFLACLRAAGCFAMAGLIPVFLKKWWMLLR